MDEASDNNGKSTEYPYNDPANRGYFKKGNPGRPLGAKGRTKRSIATALHERTNIALAALDALIAAGSEKAVLFILERNIPKTRTVELHGTTAADIETALTEDHISPDEAAKISSTLASLKSLESIGDLNERLAKIESLLEDY